MKSLTLRLAWVVVGLSLTAMAQTPAVPPATPPLAPTTASPATLPHGRRVSVLATVTDHSGNPLQVLSADQVSVQDNNQPGEVLDVSSATKLPLHIAFLLLASKTNFSQQQTAMIELAHKVLRPNIDRAFVLTARGDKAWANSRLEWQTDAGSLEKIIRGLDKNTGLPDVFAFDMSNYNANQDRRLTIVQYGGQGTGVFDILWMMMKSDPTPARHAVVVFRDPWAHSPGFGGSYTQVVEENHQRLIADAQQLWTPFYIIGVEPPQPVATELSQVYQPTFTGSGGANRAYDEEFNRTRDMAYNQGRANVERIAAQTGGGVWWSKKKNYPDAVDAIANELTSQFAITYAAPVIPGAGPAHLLQISARNSDVRIAWQRTYYSRQGQAAASQTPPAQQLPALAQPVSK